MNIHLRAAPPVELAEAPRTDLVVRVRPLAAVFAWMTALVLFLYFFNALSTVLLGVLAAAIVACTLHPMVRFVPGPRGLGAAVVGMVLIASVGGLLLALSWPLAKPIQREIDRWPQTERKVDDLLRTWTDRLGMRETVSKEEAAAAEIRYAADKGIRPEILSAEARGDVFKQLQTDKQLTVKKLLENFGTFLAGEGGQRLFSRSANVTFSILVWLIFIFVGSIFLLSGNPRQMASPAVQLTPSHLRPVMLAMLGDLGPRLRRWVLGTVISMTIVFCASLVGYLTIGLELAVPLALLAGLCEIVPTVGPAVACVIAVLVAGATGSGSNVVGVLIVYAIIQSLEAYLILPMIMRGAVKIHPAVTLFSVVLWGKIFGVPGLMLAIPINLTLWSVAEHFVVQKPVRASTAVPSAAMQ